MENGKLFSHSAEAFDPAIASLFSSSLGPVQYRTQSYSAQVQTEDESQDDSDESNEQELVGEESISGRSSHSEPTEGAELAQGKVDTSRNTNGITVRETKRGKKRQRDQEDLEGAYLQRLAREEARENEKLRAAKRTKKTSLDASPSISAQPAEADAVNELQQDLISPETEEEDDNILDVPMHESLTGDNPEMEKASRTVFLGNVSSEAITSKSSKKTLMKHLESILVDLPGGETPHKLESLRFRSVAFSSPIPKKAAFAKKEIMDATTKSTNAYAVFSTALAASAAAKHLNGSVVLGRHLRVDLVAQPAAIDHRRCVFVGNLGFVDNENEANANWDKGEKRSAKAKPPSDVEEGLWKHFGTVGTIESVRVVRDPTTRIGKGIAYVQFSDENAVEAALLLNEKKFPPMLPRKLRVARAKRPQKRSSGRPGAFNTGSTQRNGNASRTGARHPSKLLGKAGAAKVKAASRRRSTPASKLAGIKPPEDFVFEGHRAASSDGKSGLRFKGGPRKKTTKPRNGRAKRAADWKTKSQSKPKTKS